MSVAVEIVPATIEHVRHIAADMQPADAREQVRFGIAPGRALYRSWRESVWSRTGLVEGKPAAMWGVAGSLLGDVGTPWLLMGRETRRVPALRIMRIYHHEVADMTRMFPLLRNWVDAEHAAAVKALTVAGFAVGDPQPRGAHGALFRPFELEA